MEADLVAHCGGSMAGSFVHTLVLTDVATGWTECVPLIARDQTFVVEALEQVRKTLPLPLRGFDTDNDGAFINQTVLNYCRQTGLEFTRSRAYRKNDQAWVEQKNGAVVRKLAGYDRLSGVTGVKKLARLYEFSRLYVNCFQPSFKLKSKTRTGARVFKRYHAPLTPYDRVMAPPHVPKLGKEQLRTIFAQLDPIELIRNIRCVQEERAVAKTNELEQLNQNRPSLSFGSYGLFGIREKSGLHIEGKQHGIGARDQIPSKKRDPALRNNSASVRIWEPRHCSSNFGKNIPASSLMVKFGLCGAE